MAECETVHDKDRLFALYTDDVIFRDVALDVLATGKTRCGNCWKLSMLRCKGIP